jgi:hypothetical protein
MANAVTPCGFQPYGPVLSAGVYDAGGTMYPGDALKFKDDGTVIVVAAGTDAAMGVALEYAASGEKVLVSDDPSQKYSVQADEADFDAQTDIGLNVEIEPTAGNSTYRISRMEVDSSTLDTTATLPIKVLQVLPSPDNALGSEVKLIVKINNHQLGSHTGTAGV